MEVLRAPHWTTVFVEAWSGMWWSSLARLSGFLVVEAILPLPDALPPRTSSYALSRLTLYLNSFGIIFWRWVSMFFSSCT